MDGANKEHTHIAVFASGDIERYGDRVHLYKYIEGEEERFCTAGTDTVPGEVITVPCDYFEGLHKRNLRLEIENEELTEELAEWKSNAEFSWERNDEQWHENKRLSRALSVALVVMIVLLIGFIVRYIAL